MNDSNQGEPFPGSLGDVALELVAVCELEPIRTRIAHHLSRAAVERWLAFELSAALDTKLPGGWTTVVERGRASDLGPFDLLVVPRSATRGLQRLEVRTDPWPSNAIAIELKAAHLADGDAGYRTALVQDLTVKPALAEAHGRNCAAFLGLLVTTDGCWPELPDKQATAARGRADLLRIRAYPAQHPLYCMDHTSFRVQSGDWSGTAWFEAFGVADLRTAPPRDNILLDVPAGDSWDDIWRYALSGKRGPLLGHKHAQTYLGYEVGDLANARLEEFKLQGEWIGSFEELRACLYFEQRRYHHQGENPSGREADEILALVRALRARPVALPDGSAMLP